MIVVQVVLYSSLPTRFSWGILQQAIRSIMASLGVDEKAITSSQRVHLLMDQFPLFIWYQTIYSSLGLISYFLLRDDH